MNGGGKEKGKALDLRLESLSDVKMNGLQDLKGYLILR
jgi:hypothetical protein